MTNLEKVQNAIKEVTGDNFINVKPEWKLGNDLELDDLDLCEIEAELNLPDSSLVECITVADIVKVLDEQV